MSVTAAAPVLLALLGLILLVSGAELLVRGGVQLAARLGVPPIIIGLTIVAVGTSTPELAVGVSAALQGSGSLAVGNIAGTNVVNLLLILGLSALIRPLALELQTLRHDLPVMAAAAVALLLLAWDGTISRAEGSVMVLAGLAYTGAVVFWARRESRAVKADFAREYEAPPRWRISRETAWSAASLVGGIATVVVGADWLVDGAGEVARRLGVSDTVIGLTIVALGTSAPELVTTIVSTLRQARDIAIGNLLGSSVYNILIILGVTAIVPPAGLEIDPALVRIDIPVMLAATLACIPIFLSGRRVSRVEGGILVAAYVAYISYILVART